MWFLMDGVTSPGKFLGFLERKFQSLEVEKNFGMSLEILCLFQSPTPRSRPTWWSLDWQVSRAPALLVASYWAFCWSRRGFYRGSGLMLYHSRSRSLKIQRRRFCESPNQSSESWSSLMLYHYHRSSRHLFFFFFLESKLCFRVFFSLRKPETSYKP